ncbi:unnamed protein product [Paramecium octaurelia]|uniref:Tetratricopeptide repeat protein n=1 Tax=Paramecium octaurelia TaxID=43137 RepID=A0A8S1WBM8_PAROT|nr:unnamed protein product [Paramecium octaurelia]
MKQRNYPKLLLSLEKDIIIFMNQLLQQKCNCHVEEKTSLNSPQSLNQDHPHPDNNNNNDISIEKNCQDIKEFIKFNEKFVLTIKDHFKKMEIYFQQIITQTEKNIYNLNQQLEKQTCEKELINIGQFSLLNNKRQTEKDQQEFEQILYTIKNIVDAQNPINNLKISISSQDPNDDYEKGFSLYYLEKLKKAPEIWSQEISINFNHGGWNKQENSKLYKEAIETCNFAILANHQNEVALNNRGVYQLYQQNYQEAITDFKKAISFGSVNAEYNMRVALYYEQNYPQAILSFENVISKNGNNVDAWFFVWCALMKQQKFQEAYDWCIKAKTRNSFHYYALTNGGLALHCLQRREEAMDCYTNAININPNSATAWINKVISLIEEKKYQQGIDCLNDAKTRNPNYDMTYNNQDPILHHLNIDEVAITCQNKAISINFNNRCALIKLNKIQKVLKWCEKAIARDPDDDKAFNNKGSILHFLKQPEKAIVCYNNAIKINPNNSMAWINKGLILHFLHRYKEAINCYRIAIGINSQNNIAFLHKQIFPLGVSLINKLTILHQQNLKSDSLFEFEQEQRAKHQEMETLYEESKGVNEINKKI